MTGVRAAGEAAVYYLQTDQLNTPRVITDQSQAVVWKWESDGFGSIPPNEQPGTAQAFVFNPRFAGQYFDRESNLYYNYYRDYDPQAGRYMQSDPIGLGGGINTYAYVNGSPLNTIDPTGEVGVLAPAAAAATASEGAALSSNPVGWVIAAGLGGAYVGTLIYDNFEPQISKATSWAFGDPTMVLPPNVLIAGNGGVGNSSGIGTNTPYKHCRDLKGRPGWIECKDKKSGKWIPKPAPPGWPFKKEICEVVR
nr:RHS repeat-associated core domain-containing protein [Pseudoduganella ginsengisoli]